MFKSLLPKRIKKTMSLYLSMHKIAICEYKNNRPIFLAGEFIQSDAEWPLVLKKWVTEYRLQNYTVSIVLGKDFYQKFDLDKPELDEKELMATLPFAIKELVSESVFDLVVDYIDKPPQVRKKNQMTVVCINKHKVFNLRDMLSAHKLKLRTITIEEIAACQLFTYSEDVNILLSQQYNELLLSVVKERQLYFSLRIRGYNELLSDSLDGEDNILVDGLSLEIQRALDFIHSQLQISTITTLYLALQCSDIHLLSTKLSNYIGKTIKPFPTQYNYNFLLAYGGFEQEGNV